MGISNDWRIGEYISFATQFTLLFGLSFELPVVVMVFVKLGLLTYDTMSKTRSYAIVGIFVAAAIITPTPDALTLTLMALPMVILYEICIWLAYFDRKKQRIREEQEARERTEYLSRLEDEYLKNHTHETDEYKSCHTDESGEDAWRASQPEIDNLTGNDDPVINDEEKPPDLAEDK